MVENQMYSIIVADVGDGSFNVKGDSYELTIDTKDRAISPLEAFLASLGACIGYYMRIYCGKNNICFDGFTLKIKSELVKQRPLRFADIVVEIDTKGKQLASEEKERLITFVRNCPVHNTIKGNPEIHISLR